MALSRKEREFIYNRRDEIKAAAVHTERHDDGFDGWTEITVAGNEQGFTCMAMNEMGAVLWAFPFGMFESADAALATARARLEW